MKTATKNLHTLRVVPGTLAAVGAQQSGRGMLQNFGPAFGAEALGAGMTLTQWHAAQEAGKTSQASKEAKPGGFAAFIARSNAAKLQARPAAADEAKPATGFASKLRLPGKRR